MSDQHNIDMNNELRKPRLRPTHESNELARLNDALQQLSAKYDDLLMQVETKHPGESRHDTAKRYIRNAEQQDNRPEQEAT